MTNIEIRERTEKLWRELPHCCGYPKCDGDLEGEAHSEECPLFNQKPKQLWEFMIERIAAERDAAMERCCKSMCYLCAGKHSNYNPQPIVSEEYNGFYHVAMDAKTDKERDTTMTRCNATPIRARVAQEKTP